MKFSEASLDSQYRITAYETRDNYIQVNTTRLTAPFIITRDWLHSAWITTPFTALQADELALLLEQPADVLILGTGWGYQAPSPALYRALVNCGRGFEVMDNAAACRTFNLLLMESRPVAAALFL